MYEVRFVERATVLTGFRSRGSIRGAFRRVARDGEVAELYSFEGEQYVFVTTWVRQGERVKTARESYAT